jgi:hypothetical protein
MIHDFGHFTPYQPGPDHPYYIENGMYFRNENGEDFLVDIVHGQATYENGAMTGEAQFPHYASIYQGRVFFVTDDPMRIVPSDMTVIGSDEPIPLGYAWDGTVLSEPPLPVPDEISRRQFFQQMAVAGLISQAEAIAAVKSGEIPAALLAFVGSLPAEEQFAAQMLIIGATTFHRSHPLVDAFGALQGLSSAQVDDLWRAAAAI